MTGLVCAAWVLRGTMRWLVAWFVSGRRMLRGLVSGRRMLRGLVSGGGILRGLASRGGTRGMLSGLMRRIVRG
jgi:hypothetical protein